MIIKLRKQAISNPVARLLFLLPTMIAFLLMSSSAGAKFVTHSHEEPHGEVSCTEHHDCDMPLETEEHSDDHDSDGPEHTHYIDCQCPKVPAGNPVNLSVSSEEYRTETACWFDAASTIVEGSHHDIFQPPKA